MNQDSHIDEKQERLKEKLRDELGPVIVGLLDQSSGLEDILVNEDSRIWVKRTGSPKDDGDGDAASSGDAASDLEVPLRRVD
jgi:Flp pilus assembly CpaF family ATPase